MSSSFSYERYDRRSTRNRGTFTYWVPLAVTVTLAAGGIAAWVWSARSDGESSSSSDDENLSYGEEEMGRRGMGGVRAPPSYGVSEGVIREEEREMSEHHEETARGESSAREGSFLGRVQGAIRRTPSPQQVIDYAGKRVAAGVAAAGVAVGSALSAIREEDKDYEDHERWSEEAEIKKNVTATSAESSRAVEANTEAFATSVREDPSASSVTAPVPRATLSGKRKTVAVVVSGESIGSLDEEDSYTTENATLLSHLPPINTVTTNLLILIYNPTGRPPSSQTGDNKPSSLGSSYAAIPTPAQIPGEELQSMEPQPYNTPSSQTPALSSRDSHNALYDLLYKQSLKLVEKAANILTFTTATGHIHMLKHIAPDTVYIVDSLAGDRGSNIEAIRGWVGQVIVVVGGDGSGLGGLIDTEDEGEGGAADRGAKGKSRDKWWETSDMVGLGKGVEVVDGVRLPEDWERRVGGKE